MRHGRRNLAVFYALASLLAQGAHEHGQPTRDPRLAGVGCAIDLAHVEAQQTLPSDGPLRECAACSCRFQEAWTANLVRLSAPLGLTPVDEWPTPILRRFATELPACRGPPRV